MQKAPSKVPFLGLPRQAVQLAGQAANLPQKPRFGTPHAMSPSSLNAFENKSAPHSALVKANDGAERSKPSQRG